MNEPPDEARDKIESTTAAVFILVLAGAIGSAALVACVHYAFKLIGKLL